MGRSRSFVAGVLLAMLSCASGAAETLEGLTKAAETAYYDSDFRRAEDLAGEALALGLQTLAADDASLLDTYDVLAGAAERQGNWDAAERYYGALLGVLETNFGGPDSINATFGLEALARIYLRTGRIDEAEDLFQRVTAGREIMIFDGQDFFAGRHAANLARVALARGLWNEAFEGFRRSIEMTISENLLALDAGDEMTDLSSEGHSWTFVGLAQAAWQLREAPGADLPGLADETFRAMQWRWRTSAAAALFEASARPYSDDPERSRRWRSIQDIELEIAELEERSLALSNAETQAREDAGIGEDVQYDMTSEEAIADIQRSIQVGQEILELYDRCTNVPAEQYLQCNEEIEREIAELEASIAPSPEELEQIYNPPPPSEAEQAIEERFGPERIRLAEERQRLQGELEAARADFAEDYGSDAFLTEPDPLGMAEVQALLPEDAALVAFLVGEDGAFVWAATRSAYAWASVPLHGPELRAAVAAFRRSLRDTGGIGTPSDPFAGGFAAPTFDLDGAYALYEALLGGVEDVIAQKRQLLVVPSGSLTGLPFHALVTESPSPGLSGAEAYRAAQWLVRRHAVTVLPSVTSLQALDRFTQSGGADQPYQGFGDPDLDGAAPEGGPRGRGFNGLFGEEHVDLAALRLLEPLPDTADELKAVAENLGAPAESVVLGAAATETAVKTAALDQYRIIHFATHALVAGELKGVAEPGLVLTPPGEASPFDDGLLTAAEVLQLRLNADWVVLSACNTAAGSDAADEFLSGLGRAFFYAGARALLVSHWQVFSDAAAELTTRSFAEMRSDPTLGRAEALQHAMLSMIESGDDADAHPARWAPFSVVGHGWR